MNKLILVPSVGPIASITINEEGDRLKSRLLQAARPITTIENPNDRDHAIATCGLIRGHLNDIEQHRKEVKQPFLAVSRKIEQVAADHTIELENHLRRLNAMVGEFEFQRRRAEKEAAEALERAQTLLEGQDSGQGISGAEKAEALTTAIEAEEKLEAARAPQPKGGAHRDDWVIEVVDLKELYTHHPQCVKLSPIVLNIKDLLKAGVEVKGIKATPIHSYNARGVNQ